MIELQRHIEILLLSNDCVIIPDLGGFMAHHVDAKYDEKEQLFLPPLRTLGFNPQLKINDSLLVQSYIEAYDISYPEALRRIEDEVAELQQHIDNNGHYELTDIGTLYKNEDGNISFEPCEAGILTPNLYGLSSFEMPKLTASEQKGAFLSRQQPVQYQTEEEVEDTVTTEETDPEEEETATIHIKLSWIRNTIAAAAAILAFFFITSPISDSTPDALNMAQTQNGAFFHIPSKDITPQLQPMKTVKDSLIPSVIEQQQVAGKENVIDTVKTVKEVEKAPQKEYCVVLASQVKKKNAKLFVEKLHKQGYTEAEILILNNVVRVICGHYPSEAKAYQAVSKIRQNKEHAEAWVLKVNI